MTADENVEYRMNISSQLRMTLPTTTAALNFLSVRTGDLFGEVIGRKESRNGSEFPIWGNFVSCHANVPAEPYFFFIHCDWNNECHFYEWRKHFTFFLFVCLFGVGGGRNCLIDRPMPVTHFCSTSFPSCVRFSPLKVCVLRAERPGAQNCPKCASKCFNLLPWASACQSQPHFA